AVNDMVKTVVSGEPAARVASRLGRVNRSSEVVVADWSEHPIEAVHLVVGATEDQRDLVAGGVKIVERIALRRRSLGVGGQVRSTVTERIAPNLVHVPVRVEIGDVLDAGSVQHQCAGRSGGGLRARHRGAVDEMTELLIYEHLRVHADAVHWVPPR